MLALHNFDQIEFIFVSKPSPGAISWMLLFTTKEALGHFNMTCFTDIKIVIKTSNIYVFSNFVYIVLFFVK